MFGRKEKRLERERAKRLEFLQTEKDLIELREQVLERMRKAQASTGGPARGMSLRDYFAVQALAGICNSNSIYRKASEGTAKSQDLSVEAVLAWEAYAIADAMLAKRVKQEDA